MIREVEIMEQDRSLMTTARCVLDYLGQQPGLVDAYTLLRVISERCRVPEAHVATAISRVADCLDWDYSSGPVHFRLTK